MGVASFLSSKGVHAIIFKIPHQRGENCIQTPELADNHTVHAIWKKTSILKLSAEEKTFKKRNSNYSMNLNKISIVLTNGYFYFENIITILHSMIGKPFPSNDFIWLLSLKLSFRWFQNRSVPSTMLFGPA
jgi:hypothetical protein